MTLPALNLFSCAYEARHTPEKAMQYLARAMQQLDLSLPPLSLYSHDRQAMEYREQAEVLLMLAQGILCASPCVDEAFWKALEGQRHHTVGAWRAWSERAVMK